MENKDQPAYPVYDEPNCDMQGLTKRELIAAMCLQGILSNPELYKIAAENMEPKEIGDFYSEVATEQADSLLSQLNKTL